MPRVLVVDDDPSIRTVLVDLCRGMELEVEAAADGAEALDKLKQEADEEAQRVVEEGIPEQPPVPALPASEVKKRCQAARQDLATIQSRGQLRERDEKGNTRYVGEEEKQQRIKAAKKQIREYCN